MVLIKKGKCFWLVKKESLYLLPYQMSANILNHFINFFLPSPSNILL